VLWVTLSICPSSPSPVLLPDTHSYPSLSRPQKLFVPKADGSEAALWELSFRLPRQWR
jgi:hypothetical protein